MAENGQPESTGSTASNKLAVLRNRVTAEMNTLAERIEKEILQCRDWPPPEQVPVSVRKGVLSLGNRAVKLINALEKADVKLLEFDAEVKRLRQETTQAADSTELNHLKMENQVLKEHIQQLEAQAEGGQSLKDENVDLKLKLENLEAELNRLLIEAADAQELQEENQTLREEMDDIRQRQVRESEALEDGKRTKSGRLLASIWDLAEAETPEGQADEPVVRGLKSEVARLQGDLEKAKKRAKSLKGQNENLSSKVMELAEAAALRAESAMEEINSLREERNILEQERDRYRRQLESIDSDRDDESERLKGEVIKLHRRMGELEAAKAKLEAAQSLDDVVADDGSASQLENVIEALKTRIGELEDELDQREDDVARLETQLAGQQS